MKRILAAFLIVSVYNIPTMAQETTAAIVKIECKEWNKTSTENKRNFSFQYNVPEDGFARTGGGCEVANPTDGHRIIFTHSRPNKENGWYCEGGEQQGTGTNFNIVVHVVGCRAVGSN